MQTWRCHRMITCIWGGLSSHFFLQSKPVNHCLMTFFSLFFPMWKNKDIMLRSYLYSSKIVEWQVTGYWFENMLPTYWVLLVRIKQLWLQQNNQIKEAKVQLILKWVGGVTAIKEEDSIAWGQIDTQDCFRLCFGRNPG